MCQFQSFPSLPYLVSLQWFLSLVPLFKNSGGSRSYFDPGHTYNLSIMSTEAFVKNLKKYTEILKTMVGNCPILSAAGWVIWFLVWNSDHKQLIRYLEVQDCILTSPNTLAPWEVSFATLSKSNVLWKDTWKKRTHKRLMNSFLVDNDRFVICPAFYSR